MSFAHPSRRRAVSPTWGGPGSSSRSVRAGRSVPMSPVFGSGGGAVRGGGSGNGGGSSSGAGSAENRRHEQNLINAYEAEEERIINVLSRKLEQLREDKIDLENALEAESESHVNRLARELGALRAANMELEGQLADARGETSSSSPNERRNGHMSGSGSEDIRNGTGSTSQMSGWTREPTVNLVLDALRRENETLRQQLAETQRNYVRISRFNELYREELIEHRTRLGLPVDNLVGLTSADRDPFSHSTHQRSRSSSASSSPAVSQYAYTHMNNEGSTRGSVPIPRPPSQIHRPQSHMHSHTHVQPSAGSTPLSLSPSSPSAYPSLSPIYSASSASISASASTTSSSTDSSFLPGYPHHRGHHAGHYGGRRRYSATSGSGASASATPASFVSVSTTLTSPPGSLPNGNGFAGLGLGTPRAALTYPSVPPPSLSSSFGSPTVAIHAHLPPQQSLRDGSISPVDTRSRRAALPLGARVAESGSLVGRSRAGSLAQHAQAGGMPETVVEGEGDDDDVGYEDGGYADAREGEIEQGTRRDDDVLGLELGNDLGTNSAREGEFQDGTRSVADSYTRNGGETGTSVNNDETERTVTRFHGRGPALVQAGGVLVPTVLMRAPRAGGSARSESDGR